jgi:hypothetical protein
LYEENSFVTHKLNIFKVTFLSSSITEGGQEKRRKEGGMRREEGGRDDKRRVGRERDKVEVASQQYQSLSELHRTPLTLMHHLKKQLFSLNIAYL